MHGNFRFCYFLFLISTFFFFSVHLFVLDLLIDFLLTFTDWVLGTPAGEFISMAIPSDGSYGIKEGLIYSFPVTCKNGEVSIVQGLQVSDFARKLMDATAKELEEEKEVSFKICGL